MSIGHLYGLVMFGPQTPCFGRADQRRSARCVALEFQRYPLVPFWIFWRFGVIFLHSKTDDKVSCSGSSRDFTPKSLKSYFLIFLDLQSLLTICNPLGPSGNKCRMQHILLLSCNSSFQLIERFAIKEDSPLHTTKASPGGSSRSSRKNASGSAWQLRFS